MHERTGYVEPARNFAVAAASHQWVLVLDADELVTPELREYLYGLAHNKQGISGVFVPRANFFMGRFMHASYPDYQLRFFIKDGAFWPHHIHSRPQIKGKVIRIPKKSIDLALVHLQDSSIKGNLNKTNIYTDK